MNILLALLGFALYIALGMRKTALKHADKKFSPIKYLQDELLTLIVSAIAIVILLLVLPEVEKLIAPEYVKYAEILKVFSPVIIGFFNYTVFDRIFNAIIPKRFKEN